MLYGIKYINIWMGQQSSLLEFQGRYIDMIVCKENTKSHKHINTHSTKDCETENFRRMSVRTLTINETRVACNLQWYSCITDFISANLEI